MKKNEHIEFLKGAVVFIAFVAIAIAVGLVANRVLEAVGITTYISVEPYINNEGDEVSSSITGPGSSSIALGMATALYLAAVWLTPKFKGWLIAACCSVQILLLAWGILVAANYLLDYAFGYEDGWHQGIARILWIVLNITWSVGIYLAIKSVHSYFEPADTK